MELKEIDGVQLILNIRLETMSSLFDLCSKGKLAMALQAMLLLMISLSNPDHAQALLRLQAQLQAQHLYLSDQDHSLQVS